jgi:sporulation protein YlmC with PRC-barrel domain
MSVTSEPQFTGSTVVDNRGNVIGRVSDALFDGVADRPTWLVIKPGFMRSEHYVPTRDAYRTDDDHVVVPYSRDLVTSSPKANRDHVITPEERALQAQYFELDR